MKKEDYLKYLLPLVAVVVVIESLVLITGIENKERERIPLVEEKEISVTEVLPEEVEKKLSLSFATETRMMKRNNDYEVEVNLTALDLVRLDSLELYVTYDPTAFEISNLEIDNNLPKPVFAEISEKQDLVVVNYMIMDKGGYKMNESEVSSLMSFVVRPIKSGSFDFGFATGGEGETSVTMFVGNGDAGVLPFFVNNLDVEVE